jgi:succinate dehydrogenase (ubiquinone) membrane anchor subunit
MGLSTGRSSVCSQAPASSPAAFVTSSLPTPLLDGLFGNSLISGVFSLQIPLFHFCLSIPPGESSLTLSWWTTFKRKFPTLGPLFTRTLRLTSLAIGVGVYQFNTNDIGACL